jgi:hypothetical protein
MTDVAQEPQAQRSTTPQAQVQPSRQTGWVGFITFAGIMLVLVGIMQAFYGLVAIVNDNWVVFGNTHNVALDLTAWGWIHLVLGVIVALVGVGVMMGMMVARIAGVVVAGLSMLANFAWLPVYPVWSLVIIALDALIIYALIAHGREIQLH